MSRKRTPYYIETKGESIQSCHVLFTNVLSLKSFQFMILFFSFEIVVNGFNHIKKVSLSSILWSFVMNRCWIVSNTFSVPIYMSNYFIISCVMRYINPFYTHFYNSFYMVILHNFFVCLVCWLTNIYLRIIAWGIYVHRFYFKGCSCLLLVAGLFLLCRNCLGSFLFLQLQPFERVISIRSSSLL